VMSGELSSGLDAARLRVVLRDAMSGSRELRAPDDPATLTPESDGAEPAAPETEPAATQRANQDRQVRSAG